VLRMLLEHWDAESEDREQRLAERQEHVAGVQDNVLAITLNYACSAGHLRCVRLLLEHGADPSHRDFVSVSLLRLLSYIICFFRTSSYLNQLYYAQRGMTAMDYAQRFSKIKAVLTAHMQGKTDEDALEAVDEDVSVE